MHNHTAQNEPMVTLTLPLSQVNIVLKGLAELQLKESRGTFNNVELQAQAELKRHHDFLMQKEVEQNTEATPLSQETQGS